MDLKKETTHKINVEINDLHEMIIHVLEKIGYKDKDKISFKNKYRREEVFDYTDGQFDVYKDIEVFDGFEVEIKE